MFFVEWRARCSKIDFAVKRDHSLTFSIGRSKALEKYTHLAVYQRCDLQRTQRTFKPPQSSQPFQAIRG